MNLSRDLAFRKSMKKFESGHNRLDVLNVTEYIPCYLNRQIIIILSSLGIEDQVFDTLQDEMLKLMNDMLSCPEKASHYLFKYFRSLFSFAKNNDIFNYCNDAFFRDLLKTIYQKNLDDLIQKSRIYVEKARVLMGCIDETGTLGPDEVFIQCSRNYSTGKRKYNNHINI